MSTCPVHSHMASGHRTETQYSLGSTTVMLGRGRSLPTPKLPRSLRSLHLGWETKCEFSSETPGPRCELRAEVKPEVPAGTTSDPPRDLGILPH